MKKLALLIATTALLFTLSAQADEYVRGYNRKDGTYVQPHYRSTRDGNFANNYSTRGNVNPYTGAPGTKSYPSYGTSSYGSSSYRSYSTPNYGSTYRSYGSTSTYGGSGSYGSR